MGVDADTDEKVIEWQKTSGHLPEAVRHEMHRMAARDGRAEPAANAAGGVPPPEHALTAAGDGSPDQLTPLPRPGDPYTQAHSRIANGPLPTLFFLAKGQLPDGLSYFNLERVRMVEGEKPGQGPVLLVRFAGTTVTEKRVEGRNLLTLCDLIGRHLIHWLREHPTGQDDGDSRAVFIRRITETTR